MIDDRLSMTWLSNAAKLFSRTGRSSGGSSKLRHCDGARPKAVDPACCTATPPERLQTFHRRLARGGPARHPGRAPGHYHSSAYRSAPPPRRARAPVPPPADCGLRLGDGSPRRHLGAARVVAGSGAPGLLSVPRCRIRPPRRCRGAFALSWGPGLALPPPPSPFAALGGVPPALAAAPSTAPVSAGLLATSARGRL